MSYTSTSVDLTELLAVIGRERDAESERDAAETHNSHPPVLTALIVVGLVLMCTAFWSGVAVISSLVVLR